MYLFCGRINGEDIEVRIFKLCQIGLKPQENGELYF